MTTQAYYSPFFPSSHDPGVVGSTTPTPNHLTEIPPPQEIYADYKGHPLPGEVPLVFQVLRKYGQEDVSLLTTWSVSTLNCAGTISNGVVTITGVAGLGGTARVISTFLNYRIVNDISITKHVGDIPDDNPDGNAVSTNVFQPSTTANYGTSASAQISIIAGPSGKLQPELTANYSIPYDPTSIGTYPIYGKFQYRAVGSSTWIDVAPESSAARLAEMTQEQSGGGGPLP